MWKWKWVFWLTPVSPVVRSPCPIVTRTLTCPCRVGKTVSGPGGREAGIECSRGGRGPAGKGGLLMHRWGNLGGPIVIVVGGRVAQGIFVESVKRVRGRERVLHGFEVSSRRGGRGRIHCIPLSLSPLGTPILEPNLNLKKMRNSSLKRGFDKVLGLFRPEYFGPKYQEIRSVRQFYV